MGYRVDSSRNRAAVPLVVPAVVAAVEAERIPKNED